LNSYLTLHRNLDDNEFSYSCIKRSFYLSYRHLKHLIILDSNNYKEDAYASYDLILAAGAETAISFGSDFNIVLRNKVNEHHWLFGYLGYDAKNCFHQLTSNQTDYTGFEDSSFFIPDILIRIKGSAVIIDSRSEPPEFVFKKLLEQDTTTHPTPVLFSGIKHRTSKEKYINTVKQILNDIYDGIYYELNYCQEFFIESLQAEPFELFESMNEHASMPFSAFYKNKRHYLLSFSPERFLKKNGNRIISQPMKGTIRRDLNNWEDDAMLKEQLKSSEKERAENVMIVDLVRNDITRSAKAGSIQVPELCKVYTFKNLHQMISTIEAELRDNIHPCDAIINAFPMGSMTGAPKLEVMKKIDELEDTRRNAYSGCLGYFTPEGDFDFSVLIRTLCFNTETNYASYHTGSAITYDSIPEKEYEECLLKAQSFFSIFNQKST
jgi:para-aminobenzoate synthetase component 1